MPRCNKTPKPDRRHALPAVQGFQFPFQRLEKTLRARCPGSFPSGSRSAASEGAALQGFPKQGWAIPCPPAGMKERDGTGFPVPSGRSRRQYPLRLAPHNPAVPLTACRSLCFPHKLIRRCRGLLFAKMSAAFFRISSASSRSAARLLSRAASASRGSPDRGTPPARPVPPSALPVCSGPPLLCTLSGISAVLP
jgi:hypothetical protein